MKTWIPRIIRYIFTLGILYLVYGETGPWTTCGLVVLFSFDIIQDWVFDKHLELHNDSAAYITQIRKVLTKMGAKV